MLNLPLPLASLYGMDLCRAQLHGSVCVLTGMCSKLPSM